MAFDLRMANVAFAFGLRVAALIGLFGASLTLSWATRILTQATANPAVRILMHTMHISGVPATDMEQVAPFWLWLL